VKDIVGAIDRDQFGAYMDMLQALDGGDPLFQKVKYVFTKTEGAIANLEYMSEQIEARGLEGIFSIEAFDAQGTRRVARSRKEATALKQHLLTRGTTRE
jgi:hypothetical protein